MSFDCTPSIIIGAFFFALVFMDLFRQNYTDAPIHAVAGLFFMILMSSLCRQQNFLLAWILVLLPFIWILSGIYMRNNSMYSFPPLHSAFVERAYNTAK
jgi:dolichol kinase